MKKIELPKPTSQCDEEPYVEIKNGDTIIKYLYEDEVSSNLVSIKFKTVYSFTYVENEYISTLEYINGLIEVGNSKMKNDLLDAWKLRDRVVDEAFGGELIKVKHYRIYFDEFGMYEVICKDIEIEEMIK